MPPTNNKEFEFTGTAGDFFAIFLWSILCAMLSIFGAPLLMQKTGNILAPKVKVNGRSLTFDVKYWDAFKFLLVQTLLIVITLGIYYFWFMRNSYRFTLEHTHFADTAPVANQQPVSTPVESTSSAGSLPA